jgi:protein-disulfide isomerase
MPRRTPLVVAAALAAVGIVLSVVLVIEHATAHAGGTSICAISEYVNCDRVATSRFSVFLGMPVAAWGGFGYGLELLLALAGLSPRRRHAAWPAGLLFVVAALGAVVSIGLAALSTLVIGALCLFCTASWLVTFALLAAAWRACQPAGVAAALREDLALVHERRGQAFALVLAGLALLLIVLTTFPRWWQAERPLLGTPPRPGAGAAQDGATAAVGPAMSQGPLVVVEFSDYLCPACKRAYEETKALLAGRSDVHLSKRQFPLDSECNPMLKRRMHPGACDLARIGICAEQQGKLEPMEDLLFANQDAHRPIPELVRAAGLDEAKLQACIASPETDARLRADIEAAVRVGLKGTPTFVIGGRQYPNLPPELLPARGGASAAK